ACFVADDKTCHDLLRQGELDHIVRLAIAGGLDPVRAIKMASVYPAQYFGLADRGAIAPGYRADLIVVPDLAEFRPSQVYVGGVLVARDGEALFGAPALPGELTAKVSDTIRLVNFNVERLRLPGASGAARVIGMIPNQIVTADLTLDVEARDGFLVADPERDILKV